MPKLRSVLSVVAAVAMALCTTGVSWADVVYSNDFTGGQGDVTIVNQGAGAGWQANSTCPASIAAGHSSPDNLRWGTFGNCTNYGPGGAIHSVASTPSVATTSGCTLGFNYLLQFQEGPTFDNADVEVQGGATLASFANGDFVNNGTWQSIGGLALPSGNVAVDFIGDTPDLTLNTGAGWHIDDIVIDCPSGTTPATSGWGVFALLVGISVAMSAALFRLRRSEVRGL